MSHPLMFAVRPKQIPLFALSLAVGVTQANEMSAEETLARFELFDACEPMDLVVGELSSRAAEIGLTEASLVSAAESRLRSARLYDEEGMTYLYLVVNVVGAAFNVSLRYRRYMCNRAVCGYATTWDVGGTGTHGTDAGYIRLAVAEYLDKFLVEYLRVNEEACSGD